MTTLELEGAVAGLDESVYHRDPALSVSGAKKLLAPSCPAVFKHERDHGRAYKREYEYGHAAHAKVLGIGAEVVVVQKTTKDKTRVDADDYQTKSAQDHRDEIRAAGLTPLLRREVEQVDAMAAQLAAHPLAGKLLTPGTGQPELSLFWEDWAHGVTRRSRLDWWLEDHEGRPTVVDYKTTTDASPAGFAKSVFTFGYDMQRVFYGDGVAAVGLGEDADFVFIAQEKTAPYLVGVYRLDTRYRQIGRARVDAALRTFAECTATGVWPGYPEATQTLSPPGWVQRQFEDAGW